ncbi:MAG: hypothetical protein FWH42_03310 [Dehalococcoidia bacterium]|nr:hypothetical protein [Dehalococcoidia bacterium]
MRFGGAEFPVALFIFLVLLFVIIIFIAFVLYFLKAVGIYRMSVARGLRFGWLGFIPYANEFQLGQIAGEIEFGNKRIKNTGVWLLILPIVYGMVFTIGFMIIYIPFLLKIVSITEATSEIEDILPTLSVFIIVLTIFIIVMIIAEILVNLVKYLAIHKVFSHFSSGQKPVFYLLLAILIPCAYEILLFRLSSRPLVVSNTQPFAGTE